MKSMLLILIALFPAAAQAGQYYYQNGAIYYKYSKPYTYYQYGRPYTSYKYYTQKVTDYTKPDWKETYLRVVNQIKQNEAFNQAASLLMPAGATPGVAPGYAANGFYPSAAGATVGGFTQYDYNRFGAPAPHIPFDTNKAISESLTVLDTFSRYSADNQRRADETFARASGLIQQNQQGLIAIAEKQEDRALLAESRGIIAETRAMVRDQLVGQAELLRAGKPSPQEQFSFRQGHTHSQAEQQAPPPERQFQGSGDLTNYNKFCASCHGAGVQEPGGGWVFSGQQPIDTLLWGSLTLRMDPESPVKTADGRPFRMPPESSPQPSVEERRTVINELRPSVRVGAE